MAEAYLGTFTVIYMSVSKIIKIDSTTYKIWLEQDFRWKR